MTRIDPTVRPRAVHLLEYLEAVRLLREEPVRDVAAYRDRRWYADDIPLHPACAVTATGETPWLTVFKAQVPPPPVPPDAIVGYLATDISDPECEPAFVDNFDAMLSAEFDQTLGEEFDHDDYTVLDPDWDSTDYATAEEYSDPELDAFLRSGEAERLRKVLRDYVDGPWRAWASKAQLALRARALYDDLFDLRLRLQRDSGMIELVWGHALLGWTVDGTRVMHPVVTTQVQLAFDPENGTITIEPDALVQHQMELDLLQGLKITGFDLLLGMREGFRSEPVGPFDTDRAHFYERLLNVLGHDGKITDSRTAPPAGQSPTITTGWILMVRRRSTMYRRFFSGLREALESGQLDVPAPLVAVVADEPGGLDLALPQTERDSWHRAAERLLMPLSTNADFRTGTSTPGSIELEAELASAPPGDGGVVGKAGVAQDG